MALQPPSPTTPLSGGTTITTFSTTLSANGPGGTTLYYPWPAVTEAPIFTTVTGLEGIRTESVLVVTDVVGVILGVDGVVLRTATLKHKNPQSTGSTAATDTRCVEFKCWSSAAQGGTIFAAVLVGLLVLGVIIWCLKKEKSRREGRREVIMPAKRGVLATLLDGGNREKVVVEDVERGERHRRRRKSRARTRETSPSPIKSTGSSSIVEERRKSKHRSSRNHHVRHSRDDRVREVDDRHQSGSYAAPARMPSPPPRRSHTSSMRSPQNTQPEPNQPTAFMPPDPTHVMPSRDPFYSPRVRDFAAPGARGEVTRSRERSPIRERESRRQRRGSPHDDIITVEVEEDYPPPRERRRRRRRSMGEERIERESSGRRRRERSTDSYEKRQSLSQPASRKQPAKQKNSTLLENAKWLALLPLALRAIHIVAEPNGGWEQYFCSEDPKDKKKKRARSSGPEPQRQRFVQQDRDRHQERWSVRSGGPYLEDHPLRSLSADSEPRSHASPPLRPRRQNPPPVEEQFQRRRPRRQHDRKRQERSPDINEAASENGSVHQRRKTEQQLSVWEPIKVCPKKIRHSRRSEPVVRSNALESEEPHGLDNGKKTGRIPLEHVISKSRPLKIPSRFDTASSETLVS